MRGRSKEKQEDKVPDGNVADASHCLESSASANGKWEGGEDDGRGSIQGGKNY